MRANALTSVLPTGNVTRCGFRPSCAARQSGAACCSTAAAAGAMPRAPAMLAPPPSSGHLGRPPLCTRMLEADRRPATSVRHDAAATRRDAGDAGSSRTEAPIAAVRDSGRAAGGARAAARRPPALLMWLGTVAAAAAATAGGDLMARRGTMGCRAAPPLVRGRTPAPDGAAVEPLMCMDPAVARVHGGGGRRAVAAVETGGTSGCPSWVRARSGLRLSTRRRGRATHRDSYKVCGAYHASLPRQLAGGDGHAVSRASDALAATPRLRLDIFLRPWLRCVIISGHAWLSSHGGSAQAVTCTQRLAGGRGRRRCRGQPCRRGGACCQHCTCCRGASSGDAATWWSRTHDSVRRSSVHAQHPCGHAAVRAHAAPFASMRPHAPARPSG
eukprot:356486-Chlamydomonas_euryale.AAC.2